LYIYTAPNVIDELHGKLRPYGIIYCSEYISKRALGHCIYISYSSHIFVYLSKRRVSCLPVIDREALLVGYFMMLKI